MSRLSISKQTTRIAMIALAAFITVGSSGCQYNRCGLGFNSCLEKCFSRKQAKHRAAAAWEQCPNRCASDHVRQGYIDGYCDVALGGRCCTPAVAPSRYWGWRYSGLEGQQAGAQWLQGFPLGALAAQGDGASYRVAALEVPTESEFRQASHNQVPSRKEPVRNPGPDTIDDTIVMPPAYLDNPSDTYEKPNTSEEDDGADDSLKKAVDEALDKAEDAAQVPVEETNQLRVQTITSTEGKSIKHLMTSEPANTVASVKEKIAAPAKNVAAPAPVKEVAGNVKSVKEIFNDIPQLDLQQNDEVFGFGIE